MFLVVIFKEKERGLDFESLPPVDSEALAVVVTKAVKNRQYDSMIFQGAEENLNNFSQALTQSKQTGDLERLKEHVLKLSKNFNVHIRNIHHREIDIQQAIASLEFEGFTKIEAAKLVSYMLENEKEVTLGNYTVGYNGKTFYDNTVTASVEVVAEEVKDFGVELKRSPGKTTYPSKLNPTDPNKKIWQYVIKKYANKRNIHFPESLEDQWAYALKRYQEVCIKKRLIPWSRSEKPLYTDDSPKKVAELLIQEDYKLDEFTDKLFEKLLEKEFVTKLEEERPHDVEYKQQKFHITTRKALRLSSNANIDNILMWLKNEFGFAKGKGFASKQLSPTSTLMFKDEDGKLLIYNIFSLAPYNVEALLANVNLKANDTLKVLKKLLNVWFQTGKPIFKKKDLSQFEA